ncbi:MAG: hypothetical protein Q4F31_03725 [Eubacteriales bacterium]|nr:hypothetical protein [Eubacteriales bacterium]
MKLFLKKLILLAAVVSVLFSSAASADYVGDNNPAPPLGVEAALERAREFNESIANKSPEELAAEYDLDLYTDILSAYGNTEPLGGRIEISEDDTWQDVMDRLFSIYETDTYRVGVGYYNTLTGEEQYVNGDKYMVSASMFKIPTNMIIADMVSSGKITMDTEIAGAPYSYHEYMTIVHSDNERWMDLINYLGGYSQFKQLQIPYLGSDPTEELGWNYQIDNYYNAKQFIHMLRTLYDDPERFPGIIECMLEANPFSDFKEYEHRYPIAQKYGYVAQNESDGAYHTYITCCGIVYTDTPFMIVMFTDNVNLAYDLLSSYAVTMVDYTNMVAEREAKKQAEAEEQKRLEEERVLQERLEEDAAAAAAAEPVEVTPRPIITGTIDQRTIGNFSLKDCLIMGWIIIAMIICFVLIFRRNMSGRINGFWAVLAIIFAGLAMLVCVVAARMGTLYSKPKGEPSEPVNSFFTALCAGNFTEAYSYLSDYESLGLENPPDSEESRLLYNALRSSYDYSFRSDAVRDRLHAVQNVSFRHLNLDAVKNDASGRITPLLKEIVETRSRSQVYDDEGNYLESVTDEVYRKALTEALNNAAKYYTSSELDIEVDYTDGKWMMSTSPELISALLGGAA